MVQCVVRLVLVAAVVTRGGGVLLVLNGDTGRGLAVGVPAAFVLLA